MNSPDRALALPVGTVTFLLTDVEGSTRLWSTESADDMTSAIRRHAAILAEAVEREGGVRPQEQGEGDSVVAAFARPSAALAAAIAAQRALSIEPWPTARPVKVRMAVHTGEVQLRDDSNYAGQSIIRCARLRALGRGGQVLVSGATRDLAIDQDSRYEFRDLGEHPLRDLTRPERIYQLVADGLETDFPPLVASAPQLNLRSLEWGVAPFDELAIRFGAASSHSGRAAALRLGAAAWMAVIGDRLADAERLAGQALRAIDQAETEEPGIDHPARSMMRSLAMIVGVIRGTSTIDHSLLDELRHVLLSDDHGLGAHLILLEVANWYTFVDRFDDAAQIGLQTVALARTEADHNALIWALACHAELDLRRGRWSHAEHALTEALERSRAAALPTGYVSALAARLAAARGDTPLAEQLLDTARASAYDRGDGSTLMRVIAAQGFLALSTDQAARAVDLLTDLASNDRSPLPSLASIRQWDADLIEALVRDGSKDRAIALHTATSPEGTTNWGRGLWYRSAALTATDPTTGTELGSRSEGIFASIGAPFEQARSALVTGELARRAKAIRQARIVLRRADSIFVALGAEPWHQRATRELRACGDTAGQTLDLSSLTDQERAMVLAAVAGATNREIAAKSFVSVKTVETHLSRAYRKLGVRSRAQATAAINRARNTPPEHHDEIDSP